MSISKTFFNVALLLCAQQAQARIATNGKWTGNDWYDETEKIGVQNGIPYSNDPIRQRQLNSPQPLDGPVEDYMSKANVQRVSTLFTQDDWNRGFPHADSVYTYQGFLKAVAKFPFFCNETQIAGYDLDTQCKRELAGIFAHWGQETGKRDPSLGDFWTQGLFYVREIIKNDYKQGGWADAAWPSQDNVQYYGRGPMQLSWNYNYGQFSNIFVYPGTYNSKMELLIDPDRVAREGDVAMTAGIWFYMTPQNPKPSMHDVMTGNFVPNSVDLASNITAGFGTTTNILNGGLECGQPSNNAKQASRAEYYLNWLTFFNLPAEDNLYCDIQPSGMPQGGSGNVKMYLEQNWSQPNKCAPVGYMTQYSIVARDDYKRCVCDKFGSGEGDCPTADDGDVNPSPGPSPGPDPDPSPSPDPVWQTWQTLQDIRDNPHYNSASYSRTMYQVDREVDFLEEKLVQLYEIAIQNDLFNT